MRETISHGTCNGGDGRGDVLGGFIDDRSNLVCVVLMDFSLMCHHGEHTTDTYHRKTNKSKEEQGGAAETDERGKEINDAHKEADPADNQKGKTDFLEFLFGLLVVRIHLELLSYFPPICFTNRRKAERSL